MYMKKVLPLIVMMLILLAACSTEEPKPDYKGYLCEKYGFAAQELDEYYYQESIKKQVKPFLDSGLSYDVPAIEIFKYKDSYITVSDRGGFISDDYQLYDISCLIGEYFGDIIGYETPFSMFRYAGNGNVEDVFLMRYLQLEYNDIFAKKDVPFLLENGLQSEMNLYIFVKAESDLEKQIEAITGSLCSYVESNKAYQHDFQWIGFRCFCVYIYDAESELKIKRRNPRYEVELDSSFFDYRKLSEADYYDQHKFPYYYINTRFTSDNDVKWENDKPIYDNDFVAELISASYSQRNNYDDLINGFYVYYFND